MLQHTSQSSLPFGSGQSYVGSLLSIPESISHHVTIFMEELNTERI
jgi:hypothetical protein